MSFIQALLLGVIQGITEFLPVTAPVIWQLLKICLK